MKKEINIDNKLATVKYDTDSKSHLHPVTADCRKCNSKCCTFVCPAKVYEWDENAQKLRVAFENCLECGACRIICPYAAIDWRYPRATKGITYKNS